MKYWINCISKDHVLKGVKGGFTQADHGKNTRLKHLQKGDIIIFYSPRTHLKEGQKLQTFSAIGEIADEQPYQVEMTATFHPWRRKVKFYPCSEISIHDILAALSFIKDKKHWGFPFRRGLFSINKDDFVIIFQAMQAKQNE
jgi:EVE domain